MPEVKRANGTLNEDRLRRNMLSSMPLCFDLFGFLRRYPHVAARVLGNAFHLPIAKILVIEVESKPCDALEDRTAFHACVRYRRPDGQEGFVGVETKYTEPFSQKEYCTEPYLRLSSNLTVFRAEAAVRLKSLQPISFGETRS